MSNVRLFGMSGEFSFDEKETPQPQSIPSQSDGITIDLALDAVLNQLRAIGRRERTIESYQYIFEDFVAKQSIAAVDDISAQSIINYLDSLDVQNSTKLIRLKTIKAVLARFFDNGWIDRNFWKNIDIKLDREVKVGAADADIAALIRAIDKTTFVGFRDAVAIDVLYRTGIRINTLGLLREKHFNFRSLELVLGADIMKGREAMKLPISKSIAINVGMLIDANNRLRKHFGVDNDYIFISSLGTGINDSKSNSSVMSKRLTLYAKEFGLSNINAHAIRRAYAKNLLNAGANIALISKALGHKDLSTTTQYLHLDIDETAKSLRDFL